MSHVAVLSHTPDIERTLAAAARLCYSPASAESLFEAMTDEQVARVLTTILGSGHHSALEHASVTFAIEGISRACSHQLVRHRVASYNQQSQRYVRFDEAEFITPPSIAASPEWQARYTELCAQSTQLYSEMLADGIEPEDARYAFCQGVETKIVVTMNVRELLHFFELRCCRRAQWEIRDLATRMLGAAVPLAPIIFFDAGAACVRGPCPEGRMACDEPYPRKRRPGARKAGRGGSGPRTGARGSNDRGTVA